MTDSSDRYWREPENRDAFVIARQITARHARSFYWSAQLLPLEKRWATYGLYGFCRFTDNIVDEPMGRSDDELRVRLEELSDGLRRSYAGDPADEPVIEAFVTVARRHAIPIDLPLELIRGVGMDIGRPRYDTYDELYTYSYRVAGVVGIMMTHLLGYSDPEAFRYAETLGVAMQITNILRDVDEDRGMDRIYLPRDEMARFGVSEQQIIDGRMSDDLGELMISLAQWAHEGYRRAHPGIEMLTPESRFAIRAASRIYRGILNRIEARGWDPFKGRVYVSGGSKASIVIQEALRSCLPTSLRPAIPGFHRS